MALINRPSRRYKAILLAALLALTLFSAPFAVAGGLITGADVKNGSLTGRDVKNGTITKKDLAKDVVGVPGPTGPAGAPGAAGRGASATYVDRSLTTTRTTFQDEAFACPAGSSVVNGFIKPGATASYVLGSQYVDPARNALLLRVATSSDAGAPTSLTVQLVCLG